MNSDVFHAFSHQAFETRTISKQEFSISDYYVQLGIEFSAPIGQREIHLSIETVLATIDEEIAKLQHARELLAGSPDVLPTMKRRGRPAGSKNAKPVTGKRRGRPAGSKNKLAIMPKSGKGKRTLTPEGKARIAAAQKARWAAAKGEAEETKAAGKKNAKKAVSEAA